MAILLVTSFQVVKRRTSAMRAGKGCNVSPNRSTCPRNVHLVLLLAPSAFCRARDGHRIQTWSCTPVAVDAYVNAAHAARAAAPSSSSPKHGARQLTAVRHSLTSLNGAAQRPALHPRQLSSMSRFKAPGLQETWMARTHCRPKAAESRLKTRPSGDNAHGNAPGFCFTRPSPNLEHGLPVQRRDAHAQHAPHHPPACDPCTSETRREAERRAGQTTYDAGRALGSVHQLRNMRVPVDAQPAGWDRPPPDPRSR